jgi:hypothetical protein
VTEQLFLNEIYFTVGSFGSAGDIAGMFMLISQRHHKQVRFSWSFAFFTAYIHSAPRARATGLFHLHGHKFVGGPSG